MTKNWKEKIDYSENLRIKKIGNFFYAYAITTRYGGYQKERYLGRCDEKGNPVSPLHRIRKIKDHKKAIKKNEYS